MCYIVANAKETAQFSLHLFGTSIFFYVFLLGKSNDPLGTILSLFPLLSHMEK
jgi:hypothetical protein